MTAALDMDSCAKARSQMPMRGTGTRAMKPGHVGRRCLNNYPEKRRAALRYACCYRTAQSGGASAAEQRQISSRIARQPVHSHALAAIGYSKRLHALEVEFISGAIYRYSNVPPQVYRDFLSAASKAQFYDANVRGHFPSVHVKPPRT